MIFENGTKLRITYFNDAVNAAEVMIQNETSLPAVQEPTLNQNMKLHRSF